MSGTGVASRQQAPRGTPAVCLPDGSNPHRAGAWRQEVRGRAARLCESFLLRAGGGGEGAQIPPDIERRLEEAHRIAGERTSLAQWWSGANIEEAWLDLRIAEEAMILALEPADEATVRPAAEQALQHGRTYLPADHRMTTALSASLEASAPEWGLVRENAYALTVLAHEASDRQHQMMRSFRNQMVGLIAFLLALAAAAIVLVVVLDDSLTTGLLPTPPGVHTDAAVVFAMAMGAVGALFSAVPSLAQTPTNPAVFNPLRVQAALKIVVGAWSGLVGLMVVAAGMSGVTGTWADAQATTAADAGPPAQAATLAGFAVMAALFGASQEAITRFADHRAGENSGGA